VPGEQRTEAEIRREIASEREQLVGALTGLREGIAAKRAAATAAAAASALFVAGVLAARRFARR
jgi:hypothetical protein